MKEKVRAAAGKRGEKVRSDCYVEIEIKEKGGLKIDLKSKVGVLYGDQIEDLIYKMCAFYKIKNADILIEDSGALPFVIEARFELAIRRILGDKIKEYLPPMLKQNLYATAKDILRRSRLYLPGNEPKFYPNAGLHKPDGIILDLEDSVAAAEKDAAQLIVRNALRAIDFYGAERMVRINQLPAGLEDLKFIVPHNVNVILIPKCESASQVTAVEKTVNKMKIDYKLKNPIFLMPIIESALGVINSYAIATASDSVCALAVGLEDYTADLGVERTNEGKESFMARCMIINSAKAAGIQAIDTVFSDVADMEALRASVLEAKALGFEGKGCIHPRQISIVHEAFAPTAKEVDKAKKIVIAYEEAKKNGLGVVSLGSKMIDAPVVKRAHNTIKLAQLTGVISENWRDEL